MWFDDLPSGASWASLWSNYIICEHCTGIRRSDANCTVCGGPIPKFEPVTIRSPNGKEYKVPQAAMGAEGRYEDWVYLAMLEREWKRPLSDGDRFLNIAEANRPSARAAIAIIFWSYFETRIERLFRKGLHKLPEPICEDLLRRYSSVGSRLDRLYEVVFSTTYWRDLATLGFDHISVLLQRLQKKRNEFTHGKPEAIDDRLVADLVGNLKDEHEGWIAVFNNRLAAARSAI